MRVPESWTQFVTNSGRRSEKRVKNNAYRQGSANDAPLGFSQLFKKAHRIAELSNGFTEEDGGVNRRHPFDHICRVRGDFSSRGLSTSTCPTTEEMEEATTMTTRG